MARKSAFENNWPLAMGSKSKYFLRLSHLYLRQLLSKHWKSWAIFSERFSQELWANRAWVPARFCPLLVYLICWKVLWPFSCKKQFLEFIFLCSYLDISCFFFEFCMNVCLFRCFFISFLLWFDLYNYISFIHKGY